MRDRWRVNFTSEHFGSARFYLRYSLNLKTGCIGYTGKLENSSVSETTHGDPIKAKSVAELLENVQVIAALTMGPNIARMRKRFVPVVSREKNIKLALEKLKAELNALAVALAVLPGKDKEIIFIH